VDRFITVRDSFMSMRLLAMGWVRQSHAMLLRCGRVLDMCLGYSPVMWIRVTSVWGPHVDLS